MTVPNADDPGDSTFASSWDDYAKRGRADGNPWPGDEWGDAELWDAWFDRLISPFGVSDWKRAVELGQGTGKYTARALDAGCAEILACDVSRQFLDLCEERLASHVSAGRLHLLEIADNDPRALQGACAKRNWTGTVEAVFSIDALVHLPFNYVINYLVAATEVLQPSGLFIMTFANATSKAGLEKLIESVDETVRGRNDPGIGCFHWTSPDAISAAARFVGFDVLICDTDPFHHRDGHFVARFVDPRAAEQARALRKPESL